jgi:TIGR03009 family protein
MRITGWTLVVLLAVVSAAIAQPELPDFSTSTPESVKSSKVDEKLKEHLLAWEKAMEKIENVRVDVKRVFEDVLRNKKKVFTGSLLFKRPNFFIFRLESEGDPTRRDYEAYLSDGKSLFAYRGIEKTATEYRLVTSTYKNKSEYRLASPAAQIKEWRRQIPDLDATDEYLESLANIFLEIPINIIEKAMFLSGSSPKDLQQRHKISLMKEDANYVYLNLELNIQNNIFHVNTISMALYGPKTKFPYFPAKIISRLPTYEVETWDFTNLQTNVPGISEETFRYVQVPGFREIKATIPVPESKTPDDPAPTKPLSPPPETEPVTANIECPYTPSCCYERRLGWRLFRNFR